MQIWDTKQIPKSQLAKTYILSVLKFSSIKRFRLKNNSAPASRGLIFFKLFPPKYRKYVFAYYMEIIFSFPRLNDLMFKTLWIRPSDSSLPLIFMPNFKKLTWDQYMCSHWAYFKGAVETFVTKRVLLWQIWVFCWKLWQHLT